MSNYINSNDEANKVGALKEEVIRIMNEGFNSSKIDIAILHSEVGQEILVRHAFEEDLTLAIRGLGFTTLVDYIEGDEKTDWKSVYESLVGIRKKTGNTEELQQTILAAHKLAYFYTEENILNLVDLEWVNGIIS